MGDAGLFGDAPGARLAEQHRPRLTGADEELRAAAERSVHGVPAARCRCL
jgi:hypothetical protein